MLELKACTSESCDGSQYTDTTGLYSVDNLTGYGVANGVTGPSDFDTYTLSLWDPSLTPNTDTPTFTYDLLDNVPPIDPNDYYTWSFDVGVQKSGVWYMRSVATKDADTYEVNKYVVFLDDIRSKVNEAMNGIDPGHVCKKGCQDPRDLWVLLESISPRNGCDCLDVCSIAKVQTIIDFLYTKLPGCGCC